MDAKDLIDTGEKLRAIRSAREEIWQETAELTAPMLATFNGIEAVGLDDDRLVEDTAIIANQRYASVLEKTITPQGALWHGLKAGHGMEIESSGAERWFDAVTKHIFHLRYRPMSGFATGIQAIYRAVGSIGNSVLFLEEGDNIFELFKYRAFHIKECLFQLDPQNHPNACYRFYQLTAKQAADEFKDKGTISAKLREMADDIDRQNEMVDLLHAVVPMKDATDVPRALRNRAYASFHVEVDERHMIRKHGYFEFPFHFFHQPIDSGQGYGQGIGEMLRTDIKMLQEMERTALLIDQLEAEPPIAMPDDDYGAMPDFSPRGINPGAISPEGNLLWKPLHHGRNIRQVEDRLHRRAARIERAFHTDLFEILRDNPGMTATQALLLNQENLQSLVPPGTCIQQALSSMVDREYAIMDRNGFFAAEGPFTPPSELFDTDFEVEFDGPLDQARKQSEMGGLNVTVEAVGGLVELDPDVRHIVDGKKVARKVAASTGSSDILRSDEEVAERVQQEREQLAQAQQTEQLGRLASAAKDAAPLLDTLTGDV